MIFGPFEIAICLGAFMVIALAAALGLATQDVLSWFRKRGPRCPKCFASINAEAYLCWSCKTELADGGVKQKELSGSSRD